LAILSPVEAQRPSERIVYFRPRAVLTVGGDLEEDADDRQDSTRLCKSSTSPAV